jgi:hypothetical protein
MTAAPWRNLVDATGLKIRARVLTSIEPKAGALLEKQLRKPDDVSNILEYSDRFEVYRLLESTSSHLACRTRRGTQEGF